MIGNWQMSNLSEPRKYIEFSEAYLQASTETCRSMLSNQTLMTWPNACVSLMLAAHSVELFLKGAILSKDPGRVKSNHKLDDFYEIYKSLFPDVSFSFEMPFRTEFIGVTEQENETLKKDQPEPSIYFRYPVKKPGTEWNRLHGADPAEFLTVLESLKTAYQRITVQLGI